MREKLLEVIPGLRTLSADAGSEEFYGSPNVLDAELLIKALLAIADRGDIVAAIGVGPLHATPVGGINMVLRLTGSTPTRIKALFDR